MHDPLTLYAIPFAGGHSMVYRNLKPLLPEQVTLNTLELPGRGKRAGEPLVNDLELLARDLFDQIRDDLKLRNYAIFGHSMGSLLAYLVCRIISENGLPMPKHLFCSGHGAPSVPKIDLSREEAKHTLPAKDFWDYIDSLGALPPELKGHDELINYFEPILRADIQALECYHYRPSASPLDVPLSVFYGLEDMETPPEVVAPWQDESRESVTFYPFPGGHFGIFDCLPLFSELVNQKIG